MTMPEALYLAEVEWVDSTGTGDWQDTEHATGLLDLMQCSAVGHVLVDDKRGIVMALAIGGTGQVLSTMAIPRASIRAVHRLERKK